MCGNDLICARNDLTPITHKKRGELIHRRLWIGLARRIFFNAREEEEEEETGVKKNKVWDTITTSLSLSSLPMLPLLVASMAMFCISPCLPSKHFLTTTKRTGFRGSVVRTTHLSLYL